MAKGEEVKITVMAKDWLTERMSHLELSQAALSKQAAVENSSRRDLGDDRSYDLCGHENDMAALGVQIDLIASIVNNPNLKIIEKFEGDPDVICFGTELEYLLKDGEEEQIHHVRVDGTSIPPSCINYKTPIGGALIGMRVNEEKQVGSVKIKVLNIKPGF